MFTYYYIIRSSSLNNQDCRLLISVTQFHWFLTHIHVHVAKWNICLLQIMQETLSFFMFLLQVKNKNEEMKQVK
jgi:hypothetical protein